MNTRVVTGTAAAASKDNSRQQGAAGRPRPPGQTAQDEAVAALRQLLRIEADARACRSGEELCILLVNELPKLTGARQVIAFDIENRTPRIVAVTALTEIDRQSPTVRWLEKSFAAALTPAARKAPSALPLARQAEDDEAKAFPFPFAQWLPLAHGENHVRYGVLLAAEKAFENDPLTIGRRIVATAAHAETVLVGKAPRRPRKLFRRVMLALSLAGVLALAWPVPMTALAPLEIVAQDTYVIAAPIDGVIDTITVPPNTQVKAGDIIARYVDTLPKNQLLIAEREFGLADAKLKQLQQASFTDEKAKRDLAQARAELSLKQSELTLARDNFDKSQIRAPRDGTVVYGDRKDWVGKPVSTGQRILEIADVTKVEIRAHLPIADIIDVQPGARIRAFLDGNPLHPLEGKVLSVSHVARLVEGQGLAYRIQAELDARTPPPRLGVRGTAQVFSTPTFLGYYLFRRPLTWLRQKVGL